MSKQFTADELGAILEAMRKLAVSRAIHLEDYASTTEYHTLTPPIIGQEGVIRDHLVELTQHLAQQPCFSQHGEQHTMAFLWRYAEIALKSFRAKKEVA